MIGTYVLIGLVVLVLVFVKMALVIISQSETMIVERLGKYYATLKPGINIIIPFIDRAKNGDHDTGTVYLQQRDRLARAGLRLRQAERDHQG